MGTSTRPVFFTLPASVKIFVPLQPSVPIPRYQSLPFEDDERDVRQGFHVVDVGRLAPVALHGGERRARARHPSLAFERCDQGRFLTADERAASLVDGDVEIESGSEDVLAQEPGLARLLHGDPGVTHRHRVLGADVDDPVRRADRERRDHHAFDDGVRRTFQKAPVHEGARVAFVGVADEVFR